MLHKDELYCVRLLLKGPFFDEYLVCLDANGNRIYLTARVMKKQLIAHSELDEQTIKCELMIRSNLRHPFIVNQVCAFQDYDNLFYITSYEPGYLLNSKIMPSRFTLSESRFYIAEIFSGLRYFHNKSQNFTFLCPSNIMIGQDGHIKLDYSFCNCIEYGLNGIKDNIEYTSLDYLERNIFSHLSDYWSLGIVLYKMLIGSTPFTSATLDDTIANIRKCEYSIPTWIDDNASDLIHMLVNRHIFEVRPSVQELEHKIMTHPFFEDIDWKVLEEKRYEPPSTIRLPEYDLQSSPMLSTLYTSNFDINDKDGYGSTFSHYNTVHYLL